MAVIDDIDRLNDEIAEWTSGSKKDLISNLNSLGVTHVQRSPSPAPLQRVLKSALRKRYGLTDRISFKMPRHAIFLAKGVGKGRPISNPGKAKDWYNPVIDNNLDKLAEIVANGNGNLIINNLNIK